MNFMDNFILKTDSYKLTHWVDSPKNTTGAFAYIESREGAEFDFTLWFGVQYILQRYFEGTVITSEAIDQAEKLTERHLGSKELFNRSAWQHIVDEHNGCLPLEIKSVPEGTLVPTGNVLMTVESTCPKCPFLTNYVESILTHAWYSSTVATLSKATKNVMEAFLGQNGDPSNIDFMLHDFGYRGATSDEAAAIGGAGHLINFMGTDTVPAMGLAFDYYDANPLTLGFSVVATEHSIMTSLGRDGEYWILDSLLADHPNGIISVVIDSYDPYEFTKQVIARKDIILNRDGRFVLRPDSITPTHRSEEELLLWVMDELWEGFGGEVNSKGFNVLDTHVRVLWGDGIDRFGIKRILESMAANGYSSDNFVFGMGGGLLQKVNRDTQRFAFKSCAQERDGVWYDVSKEPLDGRKKSKAGRLKLINDNGFKTVRLEEEGENVLQTVFKNGELMNFSSFDEIRQRANHG